MNTSDFSSDTRYGQPVHKNKKNAVIVVLAIAFAGTWGYLLIDANKKGAVAEQNKTQIAKITDEKGDIRKSFDQSLTRLDSMSGITAVMRTKLSDENGEINRRKSAIRSILNKKNVSAAELTKAKELINQLNDKIGSMEQDVARLSLDNQSLSRDNVVLTQDKEKLVQDVSSVTVINQDLEKKVDIASTLNASNIVIRPVSLSHSGKEKMTGTAKHVSKMLISFDVNNRIAQPGATEIYVCITGPDGKNIVSSSGETGSFTTRDEGEKSFTAKIPVELDSARKKSIAFAFIPGGSFQQGNYTIQIYQNGFKIGEGARELKKGGLFS